MTLSDPAGTSRDRSKRDLLGIPHNNEGKSVILSDWPLRAKGTMFEYVQPASLSGVKFVVDLRKATSQHSVKLFVNAFPAAPKISIYESKRRKTPLQNTARKVPQSVYKNSPRSFSRFVREQNRKRSNQHGGVDRRMEEDITHIEAMTHPDRRQNSAAWFVGKAGSKYGDEDAPLSPGFASNLRRSVSRPSSNPHASSWNPSKQCVPIKTALCPNVKDINNIGDNQHACSDDGREGTLRRSSSASHPHPHSWAVRSSKCASAPTCTADYRSSSTNCTSANDDNADYLYRERSVYDGCQNKTLRTCGWVDGDTVSADPLSVLKRNNQLHPADTASTARSDSKWCHPSPTREKDSSKMDTSHRSEKSESDTSLPYESTSSSHRYGHQHTSEDAAELFDTRSKHTLSESGRSDLNARRDRMLKSAGLPVSLSLSQEATRTDTFRSHSDSHSPSHSIHTSDRKIREIEKSIVADIVSRNKSDSLWGVLGVPGFYETVGPQNFYKSQASLSHACDSRFEKALKEVDLSYGLKADKLRQWTEYAATQKLKIFVRSGRMQSR